MSLDNGYEKVIKEYLRRIEKRRNNCVSSAVIPLFIILLIYSISSVYQECPFPPISHIHSFYAHFCIPSPGNKQL